MPSNPDSLEIVQVDKRESAALGGDDSDAVEWGSDPINPEEDMIECAAVALVEAGDTRPTRERAIWPDGDDLRFRDKNNTGSGKTLTELATGGGALPPATQLGQVLYSADGATFTVELPLTSRHGWLVNDAGEHIVVG